MSGLLPHTVEGKQVTFSRRALDAFQAEMTRTHDPKHEAEESELDLDLIETIVHGSARAGRALGQTPPGVGGVIAACMYEVVLSTEQAATASDELRKYAMNASGLPWADAVASFSARETEVKAASDDAHRFYDLAVPHSHPRRILRLFDSDARRRQLAALLAENHSPFTNQLARAAAGVDELPADMVREERLLYAARQSFQAHNYEQALKSTTALTQIDSEYYRRRVSGIHAECLLELGKLSEFVVFMCERLVAAAHLHYQLPLTRLTFLRDRATRASIPHDMRLSVVLDFYSFAVSRELDQYLYVTLERVLHTQRVTRPSLLDGSGFERSTWVYFLRHVCVESRLVHTQCVSSSLAVMNERLAICQRLLELDPDEADMCHVEIQNVLRRIAIHNRRREVERAKVYVDLDGVARVATTLTRDDFNRYAALAAGGLAGELSPGRDVLKRHLHGDSVPLRGLELPANEATLIVRRIIERVRDVFVFDPQHGLDGYLSVRIRHGALAGQLRGPLERSFLVTQRDHDAGTYRPNTVWPNKSAASTAFALESLLGAFAATIDHAIEAIGAEWVQVRGNERLKGKLSFEIERHVEFALAVEIQSGHTHEQFVAAIIQVLVYHSLGRGLDELRRSIETEAKPRIVGLLTELETKVESVAGIDARELLDKIRQVRTEMGVECDRVAQWFRVNLAEIADPFRIEEAIELGVNSVRTIWPQFQASVSVSVDGDKSKLMHGVALMLLVDVMFTALENVVRHSDLAQPAANVSASIRDGTVRIEVSNRMSDASVVRARSRLNEIRAKIAAGDLATAVRREGGTGLCKIAKAIRSMHGEILDFDVHDDNAFDLVFTFPFLSPNEGAAQVSC